GWRKQKPSLSINRAKVAHRQASVTMRESMLPFYRMSLAPVKSDGLLDARDLGRRPRRSEHHDPRANRRLLVEIHHILVDHANAAGGDALSDGPGLDRAMDAKIC